MYVSYTFLIRTQPGHGNLNMTIIKSSKGSHDDAARRSSTSGSSAARSGWAAALRGLKPRDEGLQPFCRMSN